MGYTSDLGYSRTRDICTTTGYPRDQWGFLINPLSLRDGTPIEDWNKKDTELHCLTNPYGHLYWACGTGDDFVCWDYEEIETVTGQYVILDATLNCETGCFIQGNGYEVLPARSSEERKAVVKAADNMVDDAEEWCCHNEIRPTVSGWNQKPRYFVNSVAKSMFPWKFKDTWTERMFRMDTTLVHRAVMEILTGD
jgi:hypothetical protein